MKRSTIYKTIAIPMIMVFLLFGNGCDKDNNVGKTTVIEKTGSHSVKTATVVLRDVQPSVQATGTLVPRRYTKLHSLVDGKIAKLPVDIGESIRKGQLLFQTRTVDYRLNLQLAEANLARAKVLVKDRKREKNRMQNLFKAGSATEQMRDQSITGYEEAEATLKQTQAARETAAQSLSDCTVTAPYDSVVTARYIEEGEYTKKGVKIVEIMDLAILNAEMELPQRYAGKIPLGLPISLSFSTGSESITGKIVAVNPKVDTLNRTFLVKVAVDNRDGKLQAGLFCSASFKLPLIKDQMTIPTAALGRDEGRSTVWIVESGKAHLRNVREGGSLNGWIWILDGLKSGDKVVTEGAGGLTEGAEVTIKK